MDASSLIESIRQAVPGASLEVGTATDMPTVYVDREHLVEVCSALRDRSDLQFSLLVDVTAVDLLPAVPRYELVYHLACVGAAYGMGQAARLRLKVRIPGDDVHVASVTGVWPAAGWPEREVFDLFGLIFDGHADLRRILMTDDWQGHPLRKDYPVQIRKDTSAWLPLQLTPEEFAASVRGIREHAVGQSAEGPFDRRPASGPDESTGDSGA